MLSGSRYKTASVGWKKTEANGEGQGLVSHALQCDLTSAKSVSGRLQGLQYFTGYSKTRLLHQQHAGGIRTPLFNRK